MFDKIIEMLKRKGIFDYKESISELTFVIKTCNYRITCYRGIPGYKTDKIEVKNDYDSIEYTVFAGGQKSISCNIHELDLLINRLESQINMIIDDPLFTFFTEQQGK